MLTADETLLVIVDVQGRLARLMHNSDALHRQLGALIEGARLFDIPIIWLEQLPDKLGPTSADLRALLQPGCEPIAKRHFSAWASDDFRHELERLGRRHVLLAGIESHVCVYQTACDLLDNGKGVHLVSDCISSRTAENKALGIQMMQARGAWLTNLESLLFELQHEASGDRFKALLKLIK